MENRLYLQDRITENCLLFDGLTRSGKMLVAPLVSDLPRVEYAQNINVINDIPVLWGLGLIDDRSAVSFLRMIVDGCAYERAVGRHLNTRHGDVYSIYRSLQTKELLQRTFGDDGQKAIDLFNAAGRISSFVTHHTLPLAGLWFHAFPDLRILLTVRHPVDVAHSWHARGWGYRWGTDPLGFSPTLEVDGKPVPWFARAFAEEYLRLSPWDRIVKCVLDLDRMNNAALASLDVARRRQVEIISFERIATEPVAELERMAKWLETTLPPEMGIALARERVPRTLDIAERRRKFAAMRGQVGQRLFEEFTAACREYESRLGLESV